MRITWQIDDGYIGKSAPHYTEVDDDELAECETEQERQDLIAESVQADFEQTISWYITDQE